MDCQVRAHGKPGFLPLAAEIELTDKTCNWVVYEDPFCVCSAPGLTGELLV